MAESTAKRRPIDPEVQALISASGFTDHDSVRDWYQSGGETYSMVFDATSEHGARSRLIAKSCIKISSELTMREWFNRRSILEASGVNFPVVHASNFSRAFWVEEYIPYDFLAAYKSGDGPTRQQLGSGYEELYKRTRGAGFAPSSYGFHDIRSRGDDVVMIDVGSDLGPQNTIESCELSVVRDASLSLSRILARLPGRELV